MELTENDLVFVTNGSCTESAALGDNDHPPQLAVESGEGSSWSLWKHLAAQNPLFGRPEKFCSDIQATKWESATVTLLDDRIAPYIQEVCQRDPYSGKVVTSGIVTVKRLRLADELDLQPPAPLQSPAQGAAGGLDLRPLSQ